MSLGQRLQQIRKEKRLTQKQVALGTGKTERHYQDVEHDRVSPSVDFFIAVADYLNMGLDEIIGRPPVEADNDKDKIILVEKRHIVYVSALTDDSDTRNEIMRSLLEIDCIPAGMFHSNHIGNDWPSVRREIDDCDYYLLIVGPDHSIDRKPLLTQDELNFAVELNKPRAAFIHISFAKDNYMAINELFMNEIELFKAWATADELGSAVCHVISRLKKQRPSRGWMHGDEITKEQLLIERELRTRIDALEERLITSSDQADRGYS
ncbi:hypothetical protein AGMMS49957_05610 [Synergistales bacterium]|nr:hypothetical protein AGMMS49957_05610 [Synergistales bacterium]